MNNTLKALVISFVADALALGVSFGVHITTAQQATVLAFVGTTTSLGSAIVAWYDSRRLHAVALVAAAGATPLSSALDVLR